MRVRVLQKFNDLEAKVTREKGDEFITNKDRYKEMVEGLKAYNDKPFLEDITEEVKKEK